MLPHERVDQLPVDGERPLERLRLPHRDLRDGLEVDVAPDRLRGLVLGVVVRHGPTVAEPDDSSLTFSTGVGCRARYRHRMARRRRPEVPSEFTDDEDGAAYSMYTRKVSSRLDGFIVDGFEFDVCPICLDPEPTSEEHVPPRSLGGRVMTLTCNGCNNDLGTAENELRRLLNLETTAHIETTDGSVRGRRSAEVALRRSVDDSARAFVRSAAPEFDSVVNSGAGMASFRQLDMAQVSAAALKHSYLAACLVQREVPDTEGVDRVRTVLLAARGRDRPALVAGLNALLEHGGTPRVEWVETPGVPPVFLFPRDGAEGRQWMFLLGGRFTLPWPFADVDPLPASLPSPADPGAESTGAPTGEQPPE